MSTEILKIVVSMTRAIYWKSGMKTKRNFSDFFSDRMTTACTEPSMLAAMNRLAQSVDCSYGEIDTGQVAEFVRACAEPDCPDVYAWMRQYPRIVTACCSMKTDDLNAVLESIQIESATATGTALPSAAPEVRLIVRLLSPMAHGSDTKAGNNTLFRRMHVLSTAGDILMLPFYSGNAIRGQMRDLLVDDLLRRLDLKPRRDNPPVALWFFHALYSGGALEENSPAEKGIVKLRGKNGAARAEGFYELRNTLPALSVLGAAIGNRILAGRCQMHDLRPRCIEWATGDIPVASMFDWTFLTRREDHEGHDDNNNSSMIANTEVLKAGVTLDGGIDIDRPATDLERSAIGHGIQLLSSRGFLGAENRRGLGSVEITAENLPSPKRYTDFMDQNKNRIMSFLEEIGAAKIDEMEKSCTR